MISTTILDASTITHIIIIIIISIIIINIVSTYVLMYCIISN